jgi:hypothetical protein
MEFGASVQVDHPITATGEFSEDLLTRLIYQLVRKWNYQA